MKICLDCNHLEVSNYEYKGSDVPEIFRRFLRLYCRKCERDVKGYDERESDKNCPYFEKKKGG